MFRYEVDPSRKIAVLVIYGTQDGWEARLMRLDWPRLTEGHDSSWSLIVDLSDYLSPQGDGAREQAKFIRMDGGFPHGRKFLVASHSPGVNEPFTGAGIFNLKPNFHTAWTEAGGERRDIRILAPEDGTRYPAFTQPPPTRDDVFSGSPRDH